MRKPLEISLGKFKWILKPEVWMVIVMAVQGYIMYTQREIMDQQRKVMDEQSKVMSYTAIKKAPELELKSTEQGILLLLKSYSDVPLYVRPQFFPIRPKEYKEYITALALLLKSLKEGYSLYFNLLGNAFLLNPKEEKEIPFLSNSFLRNLCKEPTEICRYLKTHKELKLLIITRLCFRPIYDRKEEATNSVAYLLTIKGKNKTFPSIEVQRLNSMQLLEIDKQYHLAKPISPYNRSDK